MNFGGEIDIGPEMYEDLIHLDCGRGYNGIDLEASGTPITYGGPTGSKYEWRMAHEIGHEVDADEFPVLYQTIGLIPTQDQNSVITNFEKNASDRGEYYGIDWNYNP